MEFKLDEQFYKISELALQVDKIITEAKKAGILNDENGFSFSEIWELSAIAYLASTKGDTNHGI
ncbi:hypothetical protein [Lactobacillus crispatus]|uniref:Uncharacterized protein n=1 Tax=Lactobacillus crispatus TaxID=47770 RepID=A0A7H9EAG0_9LACO|nr:hypothetical protein [Lactobacillus crispatus]QLL74596.1 hypothetical protein GTO85_09680 [Lactobacillus crispatus]